MLCLLCGAVESLYPDQDASAVSPPREVAAPRAVTTVSLGGPTKLTSGISFRKNRVHTLAPNESVRAALQSSSFLSVACNVRYFAADVQLGFGRSPPLLSLTI